MEEAFFHTPLYREFAQLDEFFRLPGRDLNQESDVCARELILLRNNLEKINYLEGIKIKSDLSGASVSSFFSKLSNKINRLLF